MIARLCVKELLCIPCSHVKPSEACDYTAVPHEQLKRREKEYREMLEALIEFCSGYDFQKYPMPEMINTQYKAQLAIQKATGLTWEQVKERIR